MPRILINWKELGINYKMMFPPRNLSKLIISSDFKRKIMLDALQLQTETFNNPQHTYKVQNVIRRITF